MQCKKKATKDAGIKFLRIINKLNSYGLQKKNSTDKESNVLIDLGSGTFNFSLFAIGA